MVNLLFAREDFLRVYRPLLKKTFLLYKMFFWRSIFPGWSFQNAKNGQNWINWLAYYRFSEARMVTTDFSVSDTLLETYNFSCTEGFFLQLIKFRTRHRKKKTSFWWKIEILTPPKNSKKSKFVKIPLYSWNYGYC